MADGVPKLSVPTSGDHPAATPPLRESLRVSLQVSTGEWLEMLGFALGIALLASLILAALALVLSTTTQARDARPPPHLESGHAAAGTRNAAHWRELQRSGSSEQVLCRGCNSGVGGRSPRTF